MTWQIVSFIYVIKNTNHAQTEYPIEEQFYLYNDSILGMQDRINREIFDGNQAGFLGLRYYEKPAKQYCLGIRRFAPVIHEVLDKDGFLADGTHLFSNYLMLDNLKDVDLLVEEKAVYADYLNKEQNIENSNND